MNASQEKPVNAIKDIAARHGVSVEVISDAKDPDFCQVRISDDRSWELLGISRAWGWITRASMSPLHSDRIHAVMDELYETLG
jgi:hypothetical protein